MVRPNQLESIRALGDVSTLFRWRLTPINPPDVLGTTLADIDRFDILCESVELPKVTNTPIEVNLRGHKIKYSGISNYTNVWTLTFIETVENPLHALIKAWRDAIWWPGYGVAELQTDLVMDFKVQRLNNQDEAIWEYLVKNAWLEDYEDGGTLDGVTSDALKPSLTLSFDYFLDGPAGTVTNAPTTPP